MSDKQTARPAPGMTFPDCPHWGRGGRFKIDITNGQRVPVTDDEPAADAAAPIEAASTQAGADEQSSAKAPTVKEKKRA
jgi:hypothetical protein